MSNVIGISPGSSAQEVIQDVSKMSDKVRQIIVIMEMDDDTVLMKISLMKLRDQTYMLDFAKAHNMLCIQRSLFKPTKA